MLHLINAKKTNSRKHGFSLIETVIGMALLLIVIIIVYQGFTSTIQLSANTAKFEANGDLNAGKVNNKIATASITPLTDPQYEIQFAIIGTVDIDNNVSDVKKIGIFVCSETSKTNTEYGLEAYKEVSAGPNSGSSSTNRTGFWYIGKPL